MTNMELMFGEAAASNQPIGAWSFSTVPTTRSMFSEPVALNQPLGTWITSAVTNMERMVLRGRCI